MEDGRWRAKDRREMREGRKKFQFSNANFRLKFLIAAQCLGEVLRCAQDDRRLQHSRAGKQVVIG